MHIIYKLHNVITIYILLYTLVKYKVTYCTLSSIFYSFFTPFFAPPPASHRPFQLLYCKFVCSWNHRRGHTPFALNLWPTHTIAAFVKKILLFFVFFVSIVSPSYCSGRPLIRGRHIIVENIQNINGIIFKRKINEKTGKYTKNFNTTNRSCYKTVARSL